METPRFAGFIAKASQRVALVYEQIEAFDGHGLPLLPGQLDLLG